MTAAIRVLELLSMREHTVSEMLPEVGIEPANLSQQLSILRRAGLVTARREGLAVSYALTRAARDMLALGNTPRIMMLSWCWNRAVKRHAGCPPLD